MWSYNPELLELIDPDTACNETYLLFYSSEGSGILPSDHLDQKSQVLNKSQLLHLYQDIKDASTDPAGIREMRRLQ